jgi:hypothetical protein
MADRLRALELKLKHFEDKEKAQDKWNAIPSAQLPPNADDALQSHSPATLSPSELKKLRDDQAWLQRIIQANPRLLEEQSASAAKDDTSADLTARRLENLHRMEADEQLRTSPFFSSLLGNIGATSHQVPPTPLFSSPYMITPSGAYDPLTSPVPGTALELNRHRLEADRELLTSKHKKEREQAFASKAAFLQHFDKKGYLRGSRKDKGDWQNLMMYVTTLETSHGWAFAKEFLRKVWEELYPEDGSAPPTLASVLGPAPTTRYENAVALHPLVQVIHHSKANLSSPPPTGRSGTRRRSKETATPASVATPSRQNYIGSDKETRNCTVYCEHHNSWFRPETLHSSESCPQKKAGTPIAKRP